MFGNCFLEFTSELSKCNTARCQLLVQGKKYYGQWRAIVGQSCLGSLRKWNRGRFWPLFFPPPHILKILQKQTPLQQHKSKHQLYRTRVTLKKCFLHLRRSRTTRKRSLSSHTKHKMFPEQSNISATFEHFIPSQSNQFDSYNFLSSQYYLQMIQIID